QCGISAAGVSLALYAADVWGGDVLYVTTNQDSAERFSDTRLGPAIAASSALRARAGEVSNKGLRQISGRFIYVVGSGSASNALSIPADVLILDEYDHLDQRQVPLFHKRLASPRSMKLIRRFSNP